MGFDAVIFNRMRDVGPEHYGYSDEAGEPDFPIIPEQALEKSGVSTVMALFRPRVKGIWTRQGLPDPTATRIRSSEAQFDPEARGSTNILAARGPKMGALTEFVRQQIPPSVAEKDRLARARQQGFDTDRVWYHGTPQEFEEFNQDIAKWKGRGITSGYFNDLGFFFASKRKYPSKLGDVIPVYSRVRNPWRGDVEQLADFLADKNPEFIKSDFQYDSRGQRDMQRGLQELGYDGIIMKDLGWAQGEEWLIVFNPNDVRSIRAEFDPERAESANLLAAREGAVSSIYPTAGGRVANPLEEILVGNYEDFVSGPTFTKNMLIVKGYDNLRKDRTLRTDKQKANAFVDHLKDNLLYVYDSIDPAIRERSGQWYEGANKIAQELADQYNLSLEQASAALANLSPQKDWYINLSLGERLLDTYFNKQDLPFTDEMRAKAQQIFLTPPDKPTPRSLANFEKLKKAYSVIEGKSLSQLTEQGEEAFAKAMWVRLYDQTYNDPAYQIVSPEGERVAVAKNLDGSNSKIAWGSLVEIAKSIKAIENSDLNSISESLGGANKVRNF